MSSKKNLTKTNKISGRNGHKQPKDRDIKNLTTAVSGVSLKYADRPGPVILDLETTAEREKRLAKRKTLTLKAFQQAYEDHKTRRAA